MEMRSLAASSGVFCTSDMKPMNVDALYPVPILRAKAIAGATLRSKLARAAVRSDDADPLQERAVCLQRHPRERRVVDVLREGAPGWRRRRRALEVIVRAVERVERYA